MRRQVAELAAMAGFGGAGRKAKVVAKLGKRVSRKASVPSMAELSDSEDDLVDGDDMEEEFVGASTPRVLSSVGRSGFRCVLVRLPSGLQE